MTQIFGRLTGDATINSVNDKQVVNFTIAINDWYKPKDKEEGREYVTFVQCGYWTNTGIAEHLKKGAFVEACGRLFPTAFLKGDEPQGCINLQAQQVKIHVFTNNGSKEAEAAITATTRPKPIAKPRNKQKSQHGATAPAVGTTELADDLPF